MPERKFIIPAKEDPIKLADKMKRGITIEFFKRYRRVKSLAEPSKSKTSQAM